MFNREQMWKPATQAFHPRRERDTRVAARAFEHSFRRMFLALIENKRSDILVHIARSAAFRTLAQE